MSSLRYSNAPSNPSRALSRADRVSLMDALLDRPSPYHLSSAGAGGCAIVFKAVDTRTGQTFALKAPYKKDDQIGIDTLRKEADALRKLDHPNIIGYRGHMLGGDASFVAIDYVPGRTLDALFYDLTIEQYAKILQQVADAAAHCHLMGIVHRDIKPDNIIVGSDLKLIDFGLSRGINQTPDFVSGTPEYMDPQRVDLARSSPHDDVYALGMMLFERCGGRKLVVRSVSPNPSLSDIAAFHASIPLAMDSTNLFGESVPSDLVYAASLARHPDPSLRLSSASEFAELLSVFSR